MKRCNKCGETKRLEEFYRDAKSSDGRKRDCTSCRKQAVSDYRAANREMVNQKKRESSRQRGNPEQRLERERRRNAPTDKRLRARDGLLRAKHGIDLVAYERMLAAQAGVCAICHRPPTRTAPQTMYLHVDHDHATGVIRGLLCKACNQAIGLFRDDALRLGAAIAYLRKAGPDD